MQLYKLFKSSKKEKNIVTKVRKRHLLNFSSKFWVYIRTWLNLAFITPSPPLPLWLTTVPALVFQ